MFLPCFCRCPSVLSFWGLLSIYIYISIYIYTYIHTYILYCYIYIYTHIFGIQAGPRTAIRKSATRHRNHWGLSENRAFQCIVIMVVSGHAASSFRQTRISYSYIYIYVIYVPIMSPLYTHIIICIYIYYVYIYIYPVPNIPLDIPSSNQT